MSIEERLESIDERLAALESSFAATREQQEVSGSQLRRDISELADIARLHQQALRLSQENQRRNDDLFREMREDIQQIWQYLLGRQGNGSRGSEP